MRTALIILVTLLGLYIGFVYATIERNGEELSTYAVYKYNLMANTMYILSLIANLFLIRSSTRKEKDFTIIAVFYGVGSLMYGTILIKVLGWLLLGMLFVRLYRTIFPRSEFIGSTEGESGDSIPTAIANPTPTSSR